MDLSVFELEEPGPPPVKDIKPERPACTTWCHIFDPLIVGFRNVPFFCNKRDCPFCFKRFVAQERKRVYQAWHDSEENLFYEEYDSDHWHKNVVKYVNDKNLFYCIPQGNKVVVFFHKSANRGNPISEAEIDNFDYESLVKNRETQQRRSGKLGAKIDDTSGTVIETRLSCVFREGELEFNERAGISNRHTMIAQQAALDAIVGMEIKTIKDVETMMLTANLEFKSQIENMGYKVLVIPYRMKITDKQLLSIIDIYTQSSWLKNRDNHKTPYNLDLYPEFDDDIGFD